MSSLSLNALSIFRSVHRSRVPHCFNTRERHVGVGGRVLNGESYTRPGLASATAPPRTRADNLNCRTGADLDAGSSAETKENTPGSRPEQQRVDSRLGKKAKARQRSRGPGHACAYSRGHSLQGRGSKILLRTLQLQSASGGDGPDPGQQQGKGGMGQDQPWPP